MGLLRSSLSLLVVAAGVTLAAEDQVCGVSPAATSSNAPLAELLGVNSALACSKQCDDEPSCESFCFGMLEDDTVQCILYACPATEIPPHDGTDLVAYDNACASIPDVVPTIGNPSGINERSVEMDPEADDFVELHPSSAPKPVKIARSVPKQSSAPKPAKVPRSGPHQSSGPEAVRVARGAARQSSAPKPVKVARGAPQKSSAPKPAKIARSVVHPSSAPKAAKVARNAVHPSSAPKAAKVARNVPHQSTAPKAIKAARAAPRQSSAPKPVKAARSVPHPSSAPKAVKVARKTVHPSAAPKPAQARTARRAFRG